MSGRSPNARPAEDDPRSRLGLDELATTEEVLAAHGEVVAFLATAPRSLRGWSRVQAAAADEALTQLLDPAAPAVPSALGGQNGRTASQPGGPATPPVRRAAPPVAPVPAAPDIAAVVADPAPLEEHDVPLDPAARQPDDELFDSLLAEVTPSMHRESMPDPRGTSRTTSSANGRKHAAQAERRAAAAHAPAPAPAAPAGRSARRFALPAAAIAGALAILFVGYQLGSAPGTLPTPTAPAGNQQPQLDEERVLALMQRVQANPSDIDALMALGDAFYAVGDFGASATWFDKAVGIDGDNSRARLALGAARFNLGDMDSARTHWEAVLERDPANVEAHYDMGFLYLNMTPPDYEGVQRSWGEVVRLAPDSDIAATVQAHLNALAARSSAAPSVAPSATPVATPVATPTPEATAQP